MCDSERCAGNAASIMVQLCKHIVELEARVSEEPADERVSLLCDRVSALQKRLHEQEDNNNKHLQHITQLETEVRTLTARYSALNHAPLSAEQRLVQQGLEKANKELGEVVAKMLDAKGRLQNLERERTRNNYLHKMLLDAIELLLGNRNVESWEQLLKTRVLDPDGWCHENVSMNYPISFLTFARLWMRSTCSQPPTGLLKATVEFLSRYDLEPAEDDE